MLVFSSMCLYEPVNQPEQHHHHPTTTQYYVYIIFMRQHKYEAILLNVKFTMQFPACIYSFKKRGSPRRTQDDQSTVSKTHEDQDYIVTLQYTRRTNVQRHVRYIFKLHKLVVHGYYAIRARLGGQVHSILQSDTMVWQQPLHYTLTRPDA